MKVERGHGLLSETHRTRRSVTTVHNRSSVQGCPGPHVSLVSGANFGIEVVVTRCRKVWTPEYSDVLRSQTLLFVLETYRTFPDPSHYTYSKRSTIGYDFDGRCQFVTHERRMSGERTGPGKPICGTSQRSRKGLTPVCVPSRVTCRTCQNRYPPSPVFSVFSLEIVKRCVRLDIPDPGCLACSMSHLEWFTRP